MQQYLKRAMAEMRKTFFSGSAADVRKKLQTIGLAGIVALAMLVYFFTGFLNSYLLFVLLLFMFVACYVSSRTIISDGNNELAFDALRVLRLRRKTRFEQLWYLPLITLLIGYVQGSWRLGNLIDSIVIICMLFILLDTPRRVGVYSVSIKLMRWGALFFAVSIWVQKLLPDVYQIYLNALNNGSEAKINELTNYCTGFTTSPGHTATYIALGICVFLQDFFEKKWRTCIVVFFLLLSLFFTGMRMPVLAVCICVAFFMLTNTPVEKRKKFFIYVLYAAVIAIVLMLVFSKPLSKIPVLHRTFASVQALLRGEDVSSGRIGLYKHAISLFLKHPIFGIGWGNYKGTTVGVVTQATPFEVHNIFLQLLCETGIVGCVCFVVPMIYTLVRTIRYYGQLVSLNPNGNWTKLMGFSCLFQLYFLLFGMTDNVLYYTAQEMLYLVCCSFPVTYARHVSVWKARKQKEKGGC